MMTSYAQTSIFVEAADVADFIRRTGFELAVANNGGYLIQACSSADILAVLYTHAMRLGAPPQARVPAPFSGVPGSLHPSPWGGLFNGDDRPDYDRFILSPAHYSMSVYAALVAVGRLSSDALSTYNVDGTSLEMIGAEHSPGIEVTGGSLAQALSVGVGRAMWRKRSGAAGRVWVLISDGETQEGQTWEALQAAAAFQLDNLRVLVDVNGWQVDGPMDSVMPVGSIAAKATAFGCEVVEVDGHSHEELIRATSTTPRDRPLCIVCHTEPSRGFPAVSGRDPSMTHFIRFRPGEADEFRSTSPLYGSPS